MHLLVPYALPDGWFSNIQNRMAQVKIMSDDTDGNFQPAVQVSARHAGTNSSWGMVVWAWTLLTPVFCWT
jgi:hypothetical protein